MHKVQIARADATVKLHDALNKCWAKCFPRKPGRTLNHIDPAIFFSPFVNYGVEVYEASAEVLLELKPQPTEYEDWLNFGLKTLVCDELAPYRKPETFANPLTVPPSGWREHMAITWRLFDHPDHASLHHHASRLTDALEDPRDYHFDRFITMLHKAISRRTVSLLREGLKRLGTPSAANPGTGQIRRRPGPKPDLEAARRVQELVHAEHGDWKDAIRLKHLCGEFDRLELKTPKTWAKQGCQGWVDTLEYRRDWVVKAIERRLAKIAV